jgi:hypothetical protein
MMRCSMPAADLSPPHKAISRDSGSCRSLDFIYRDERPEWVEPPRSVAFSGKGRKVGSAPLVGGLCVGVCRVAGARSSCRRTHPRGGKKPFAGRVEH